MKTNLLFLGTVVTVFGALTFNPLPFLSGIGLIVVASKIKVKCPMCRRETTNDGLCDECRPTAADEGHAGSPHEDTRYD